jgi:ADP-heptose:LPS heptosyltransferase
VGGNQEKRVSDVFEQNLLLRLLEDGCTVLLDKGAGEDERNRADRLVELVKNGGSSVIELNRESAAQLPLTQPLRCDLLTWDGEIGAFSGLISKCDEYLGYDSAGQHIAAALGVPTIDIFTSSASAIFRERWKPSRRAVVHAVAADSSADHALTQVLACHQEIKNKAGDIKNKAGECD